MDCLITALSLSLFKLQNFEEQCVFRAPGCWEEIVVIKRMVIVYSVYVLLCLGVRVDYCSCFIIMRILFRVHHCHHCNERSWLMMHIQRSQEFDFTLHPSHLNALEESSGVWMLVNT